MAGTTLDEIDVEYYLSQRNQKTMRADVPPSILIEPYPDKLTLMLCETNEFCLFEGTPIEFFKELEGINSSLADCWVDNGNDGLMNLGLSTAERLKFSSSFSTIPSVPEKQPHPARFLLGAELTWSMLSADTDVSRDVFPQIRTEILKATAEIETRLMLLVDEPGTGKTAFMKRLAFDISKSSRLVFFYSGNGFELEPIKVAEILDSIVGECIIFIDNWADSITSFTLILDKLKKTDILFVCSERDYRLPYIENVLTNEDYLQIKDFLGLTQNESKSLLRLHEENGLSTLGQRNIDVTTYLKETIDKPIAIAVCRIQNEFKQLKKIASDLAAECDGEEFSAYITVALARFCFSKGVRRDILASTSASGAVEHLFSPEASLPLKYSDEDASFVIPKQPVLGDTLLDLAKSNMSVSLPNKDPKVLLNAFVDLALGVSSRVTPGAIKRKTPESQILGRLMDFDTNVKRFIDEHAEEFYSKLKDTCDWNSRYWEQLSLLKLDRFYSSPEDRFLLEESIQNARSALAKETHPFSFTTLAKILFRAMEKSPNSRDTYFNEAWMNLVEANKLERRWTSRGATLFVVCFAGVLDFLELGGQLTGEQSEELRDMISETHALSIKDRRFLNLRDQLKEALSY